MPALVRDKDGKPKFGSVFQEDPRKIPLGLWDMLTDQEKQDILDNSNLTEAEKDEVLWA